MMPVAQPGTAQPVSAEPRIAQTPRDTVFTDGTARLYRFRGTGRAVSPKQLPVLLVPSLINRWFVLDLRPGASLAEALVERGLDVWCLDWGVPEPEDRYLEWPDLLDRLARMSRRVLRETGAPKLAMLGYCIGGTLAAIHAALHPEQIAGLINLAGPFDFSKIGKLGVMTDPRWFDADAIAAAGNMTADAMQQGFQSLRPTAQLAKWHGYVDKAHDPAFRESFAALEAWSGDNIPFPAAAYATWVKEFYQQNLLVQGLHHVRGKRVDLAAITCPLMTVVTARDEICPPPAALALDRLASSTDKKTVVVPGGHVGAVIGRSAKTHLYPQIGTWLADKTRTL